MKKEYRIVATIDYMEANGETRHYDTAFPCWGNGLPYRNRFDTKSDAVKELRLLKELCAESDKEVNKRFELDPRHNHHREHTNIRIQMREVTEWSDVK